MGKVPYSKYTKELRLEAVRVVTEGSLSAGEAAMRLSMPKSTLENWLRAFRAGKLEGIGKGHRPLSDEASSDQLSYGFLNRLVCFCCSTHPFDIQVLS